MANVKSGAPGAGPTVAVEVTPIEHWLELEAGVTRYSAGAPRNRARIFFSRNPGPFPRKQSLWFGVGTEWVHTNEYRPTPNSVSAEAVLDFMFWASAKHRFGWYLEPSYEYNFGRGHEQSLGISGGLLIAIP
jgi:hypothetical protein